MKKPAGCFRKHPSNPFTTALTPCSSVRGRASNVTIWVSFRTTCSQKGRDSGGKGSTELPRWNGNFDVMQLSVGRNWSISVTASCITVRHEQGLTAILWGIFGFWVSGMDTEGGRPFSCFGWLDSVGSENLFILFCRRGTSICRFPCMLFQGL